MQRGDPTKLKFECLKCRNEINIPTDRAQRVDKKNRFICLVMMLSPRVMAIKMLKMFHFFNFLLMLVKN